MGGSTLLVRHLPSTLSKDEKEDLLKHFGACRVRVMGNKGPLVRNVVRNDVADLRIFYKCYLYVTLSSVSIFICDKLYTEIREVLSSLHPTFLF